MKISKRGLDELLDAGPAASVFNPIDDLLGYAAEDRQFVGRGPHAHELAENTDLPRMQFAPRVAIPARVNKTGFPLLLGVNGQGDPLKVYGPIVGFDSVYVIDRQPLDEARHESAPDQAVNEKFLSPSVNLDGDNIVPVRLIGRRHRARRLACDMGRPPSPQAFVTVSASPDVPLVGNFEDAAISLDPINFLPLFHVCPCVHTSDGH